MATSPIGGESAPVIHPRTIPPAPAVMAILDRFNRDELGHTIEVLVALLDIWDDDPDLEPGGDDEPLEANGDTQDTAWTEWHTRGRLKDNPGVRDHRLLLEDEEEDNEERGLDEAEPNFVSVKCYEGGAGCPIADSGGCGARAAAC